ncbi:MAG: SufD family Fe-S cluster assembly protein [Bacteroidales bacterium]|jgi:Fe-S cluster assembly protein SufD|nr:SufD family Fe-S cluster assembly protein [Bacteroidales bacterium]
MNGLSIPEQDVYRFVADATKAVYEEWNGIVAGNRAGIVEKFGSMEIFLRHCRIHASVTDAASINGFMLYVPCGKHSDKPLLIRSSGGNNLIYIASGGVADVLVYDSNEEDATTIRLDEAASLHMVRLQQGGQKSVSTHIKAWQASSSRMSVHCVTFGNVRNTLDATLAGKDAEHVVRGLTFTKEAEHAANHVDITHASPECSSNQLFRHILSGTSTGDFTGRIVVSANAQKTTAYQRSSNILLHPETKMNITPQLEIYADDVKCSHGATVGQLDAEAVFYLRSRGIGEAEARKILLQALAEELLKDIASPAVKQRILQHLQIMKYK